MADNFPKISSRQQTQIQEAQRTPSRKNRKKFIPDHIIVKLLKAKDKEKIFQRTKI